MIRMPNFCNRLNPMHFATALNTLTRLGIDTRNVYIVAIGRYQNYKGEVQAQIPAAGEELTSRSEIRLEVGYSSAVDQLPYQFFFGFGSTMANRTDEWETNARAFMSPFDSSVIRALAECQLKELTFGFGLQREEHIRRFLGLFAVDTSHLSGDVDELILWRNLMPYFHEWSGNADFLCELLEFVTGCECEIIENTAITTEIPQQTRMKLGSVHSIVGVDCVVGKSLTDIDSGFRLRIKNVDLIRIGDLLPGGKLRKRVEQILSFCAPATADCNISIIGKPIPTGIGGAPGHCYLGHSSFAGVS